LCYRPDTRDDVRISGPLAQQIGVHRLERLAYVHLHIAQPDPFDPWLFCAFLWLCFHHNSPRFRLNKMMKNGPPRRAVITPTGISVGAKSVRAAVSHNTRNAAPRKKDAGISVRWPGPETSRTVCGTIRPTNPMGPLNAVTAP